MNANLFLRRGAALTLLLICMLSAACGGRQDHEWQAAHGAKEEFSFEQEDCGKDCPYVLNLSSARIHRADCRYVETIKEEHRYPVADTQRAAEEGYRYCSACFPKETSYEDQQNNEE